MVGCQKKVSGVVVRKRGVAQFLFGDAQHCRGHAQLRQAALQCFEDEGKHWAAGIHKGEVQLREEGARRRRRQQRHVVGTGLLLAVRGCKE